MPASFHNAMRKTDNKNSPLADRNTLSIMAVYLFDVTVFRSNGLCSYTLALLIYTSLIAALVAFETDSLMCETPKMERTGDHVDDIMSLVGFGRWQITQSVLLFLFFLSWSNTLVSIVVIGFVPDFACLPLDNDTKSNEWNSASDPVFDSKCTRCNPTTNESELCGNGYLYATPKKASIVSEWDLVCRKSVLADTSQSALTIGLTAGAAIFPPLSDRFGRRKLILVNHALFAVTSLATAFSPNIWLFIASRIVIGALLSGTGMTSWVLALELFIPKYRSLAALLSNIVWAVCMLLLPLIGYLMDGQSWRSVQLAFSIYSLLWIAQILKIRESVRWLLAKGRKNEAFRIIRSAAKVNKTDPVSLEKLETEYLLDAVSINANSAVQTCTEETANSIAHIPLTNIHPQARDTTTKDEEKSARVPIIEIIKHPVLRKITAILCCAWFSNSLTYMGIYLLSSSMSGSRYLNLFLTSVAEIPAAAFLLPLSLRFGRRTLCVAFNTLAGISLITTAILHLTAHGHVADVVQTCILVLGKYGTSSSFMLLFMYTPELYPTSIRSVGLGMSDLCSRTGSFIASFTASVARSVPWVPSCVFGGLGLIVAFLCMFLPETSNRELPQTLEDLELLASGRDTRKQFKETEISLVDRT